MSSTVPGLSRQWILGAVLAGVTLGYTAAVDPVVHSIDQVLYPVIWIGISAGALWLLPRGSWSSVGPGSALVGVGYTLVLLWTAGLVGSSAGAAGLSIHLGLPGWGPAVVYTADFLRVTVVPFLIVGYATLGVLAAVAFQTSWGAAGPGLIGLFACVSCTAPLLAAVAGSLGAGSVAAALTTAQYPVATAIFAVSAGALTAIARRGAPACERPSA